MKLGDKRTIGNNSSHNDHGTLTHSNTSVYPILMILYIGLLMIIGCSDPECCNNNIIDEQSPCFWYINM